MGLFERTHLSDKTPLPNAAARVVVCTKTGQWNPLPSAQADLREGRVQRRSRCGVEKSPMPSRLTGIANQHKPTLRVGLYYPVNIWCDSKACKHI